MKVDDEVASDAEVCVGGHNTVGTTRSHSLLLHHMFPIFLWRAVTLAYVNSCTAPNHGDILSPDHWACYEHLMSEMNIERAVSVELDSNKQMKISTCPDLLLEAVLQEWTRPESWQGHQELLHLSTWIMWWIPEETVGVIRWPWAFVYIGNCDVAGWVVQINEIYGNSMVCQVAKWLEAGNNSMGDVQKVSSCIRAWNRGGGERTTVAWSHFSEPFSLCTFLIFKDSCAISLFV